MSDTTLRVGVDVGGTNIRAAIVDTETGDVVSPVLKVACPADDEAAIVRAIADLATDAMAGRVLPVGVACAAMLDPARSRVLFAPNLVWHDLPLREHLEAALGTDVTLANDADAATWAQYCAGAGQGAHTMLGLTVGTGVGGGIVEQGRLLVGGFGGGGEVGHILARSEGPECGCGRRGCLEAVAAGPALVRAARDALSTGAPASAVLTDDDVADAIRAQDPRVAAAVREHGRALGSGIATLVAVIDPDVVVIGGGVVDLAGPAWLQAVDEAAAEQRPGGTRRPAASIRSAQFSSTAGLVGAALLAGPSMEGAS